MSVKQEKMESFLFKYPFHSKSFEMAYKET